MNKGNADEGDRPLVGARTRAVEETPVLMDIWHDLASARLPHAPGHALADTIPPKRPLVGLQPARSLDAQLVPFQQRHRAAQHAHAPFKDIKNLLEQSPYIPFPNDNGTDFLQDRYFRRKLQSHAE